MKRTHLSLKWLDVFRVVSQSGSVQEAAVRTGLAVSTVSQHLKSLEEHLGVALLDHGRRPMVLTAQGARYLKYAEEALASLDRGQAEISATAPQTLRQLRFAMIEDFDSDIGPEVTRILARALPGCRFTHYTRVSHEILDLLRNRDLDLGVATQPQADLEGVETYPLLRDPFVLAVPATAEHSGEDFLAGRSELPLLRYSKKLIMGALVEAQLSRLRVSLDNTFELDSTASIMALVAQGNGWAITTPGNYVRAKPFQSQIRLLPFPSREFARTICLFVAEAQAKGVARLVSSAMRSLLSSHAIAPAVSDYDWLKDRYRLLPDDLASSGS